MFSQIDLDELWLAFGSKLHFRYIQCTNSWSCQGIVSSNVQNFASFIIFWPDVTQFQHNARWGKKTSWKVLLKHSSWKPWRDLSLSLLGVTCSAYVWSDQWCSNSQWHQEMVIYTEVRRPWEHAGWQSLWTTLPEASQCRHELVQERVHCQVSKCTVLYFYSAECERLI